MRRWGIAAAGLLAALALVPALAQQPPPNLPPLPTTPPPATPPPMSMEPQGAVVIDVPNDAGNQIAAVWKWPGDPPADATVSLEVKGTDLLAKYELTEAQRNRLNRAREQEKTDLAPLLPDRDRLAEEKEKTDEALAKLQAVPTDQQDQAAIAQARDASWAASNALDAQQAKIDHIHDRFVAQASYWDWGKLGSVNLADKARNYDWLSALVGKREYLPTDGQRPVGGLETVGDHTEIFGAKPDNADSEILIASALIVPNPAPSDAPHDDYDEQPPAVIQIPLEHGRMYVAQLVVAAGGGEPRNFSLGPVHPQTDFFKKTVWNNFAIAVVFAVIILVAIAIARKHGHKLFVRRIAGLEAVDEAIGRATEMGKPVLYLNGMTDLTDLSTLAAVNILGRVARRIADYDSQLLVPCRDPVVMTVAQEIVRSNYGDAGRPDAYREQDIFFLTQDQFSYTATTCGIMLREKPAANFFMGYYYAESLLLAETGQSTGAIQIAGTDSQSQLPFFITTCDYTLIGEELYAASAYLAREPMLLGSLKGQDLAKLVMMLLIALQTLLFLYKLLAHSDAPLDFLRNLVQPL